MLRRKGSCFLCQAFFFLWETAVVACSGAVLSVCLKKGGEFFSSDISTEPSCLPPFVLFSIQCSDEKPFKNSNAKGFPYKEKCDTKMAEFAFVFRLRLLCGELEQDGPLFSLLKVGSISSSPAANRMTSGELTRKN